jgi:hypothetical protein
MVSQRIADSQARSRDGRLPLVLLLPGVVSCAALSKTHDDHSAYASAASLCSPERDFVSVRADCLGQPDSLCPGCIIGPERIRTFDAEETPKLDAGTVYPALDGADCTMSNLGSLLVGHPGSANQN